MRLIVLVGLSMIGMVIGYHGVDVSQRTLKDSWKCLKDNGKSFAIVRVYQSNGVCDPNGPGSINDAWAGGISHVDGYIFPCYSCGNPAGQMDATINYLSSHNVRVTAPENVVGSYNSTLSATVGMLWIDVEGTGYWSSSAANNVNFLHGMINQGKSRGVSIGVYSSNSQWSPITGNSHDFSSLPLWYAHYDGKDNYSDFAAFGGWTKPAIKQYQGTTSTCSASVDLNYY